MNKLYNKIYKAINEGIQKALLINPEQNDVSINYSYHKINNDIDTRNFFDDAVNDFLNYPNIKNYTTVLTYSANGKYQYKVNNFKELMNIFYKISSLTNNINLSWINTANALLFIMNDGSELQLNEIDNKNNVVFIKFVNIQNYYADDFINPIIIHKNLLDNAELIWSDKCVSVGQAHYRNEGYANTNIVKEKKNLNNYPAFEYCINIRDNYPNLNFLNYECYLPAIYELRFLSDNIQLANYILKYINGKELNINTGCWWSSTQDSSEHAWYLRDGSHKYFFKNIYCWRILPFFAKIN